MSTSAEAIIRASLLDLGVIQPSDSVPAQQAQSALLSLNHLTSGLQTQFQTITAVERTIFPLIDNQQTYFIGPGGNFNVPRPLAINGAALWLNGLDSAESVTGITRNGYTATVTQTTHGFAVGDEVFIDGCDQILYNGLQTVQTVPTGNTYTFTLQGQAVTPATGTITAAAVQDQPVEIPVPVITDTSYQGQQLKNMPNPQFTSVYYNTTPGPFGEIVLWPKPNTAANQLVLYLQNVFTEFAGLTNQYEYPSLPGYFEMLQYQLDLRLAIPYGIDVSGLISSMASKTMGLIKRANNKLLDLSNDAALISRRKGWYNIQTGNG